ncbi:MAG TPA: DDE-type integrase/transposase/recombinase [Planctomycetota bacterium]|nr:DDE-type integrase/transposase/recombinase [Planctomycetota bacterium]
MEPGHDHRTRWALWRFSILGPLVSARLEHGDRRALFEEIARRTHIAPDGSARTFSRRTIEAWYYVWKKKGLGGLKDCPRSDLGKSSIRVELRERLLVLKRENPRRSIPRLIKILERTGDAVKGELSRSAVQRYLRLEGLSGRAGDAEPPERRSFRHPEPGDLWMGDVLHGPAVLNSGRLRKSYLIAFIDSATRFVPAAEVRLSESAADHEYALKQAILKHGLPRVLYLDNGAAQSSHSLKLICAELSIRLLHAEAYDPQAKGAIERWNRTWREEVEGELPKEPLTLQELQSRVWSWLAVEYNARQHDTTGKAPLEHWLEKTDVLRTVPPWISLDEVFLHRERRVVRRDGTVRFRGGFLEVRSSLVGKEVELRFDPFDETALPRVFLEGKFVCDTVRFDPISNSARRRHRPGGQAKEAFPSSGIDPLRLIEDEHLRRARPPGGISFHDQDDNDDDDEMEIHAHV